MNSILNKEPVLRAEKSLKQFNPDIVIILVSSSQNYALTKNVLENYK